MQSENLYKQYTETLRKVADIDYASAVLQWDMETYIPEKGAELRGQQISTLSGLAHDFFVTPAFGKILDELLKSNQTDKIKNKNVKLTHEDYIKEKKYSTDFVVELSNETSKAFPNWVKAREENNPSVFLPNLEKLVDLKRREADFLGYEDHPYDALMDDYEPGVKSKDIDVLFTEVRNHLKDFVKTISSKSAPKSDFLFLHYDKQKQWNFGIGLLKQMSFDFSAGRQDISVHPFTTSFSPQDVRVTTKVEENDFRSMTWSCIHEGGHALYEQGLLTEQYGLPCGSACSLGIHESQSRLWENVVGRSLNFWKVNYPKLQSVFPENLSKVPLEDFYKSINVVKPSLIRIEADELTYHFHIMIRYEIEKRLIENSLKVKDVPEAWNEAYKTYLGIDVPTYRHGMLQDVHWSHGSFGYFPTYSLGSFYAVQFFHQAKKDVPDLEKNIIAGNTKPLLDWLREKIHYHGRFYNSQELCEHITGEKLNYKYFKEYAEKKYSQIYNIN
jgi:carboxypeptidase Taq